jgi:hypothetical protein
VPEKESMSPEAPTTVAQPDALDKQNEADARQLQELSVLDEDLCAICMESEKTHIVIPCGHQCICGPCSEAVTDKQCPVCRQECSGVFRVFR